VAGSLPYSLPNYHNLGPADWVSETSPSSEAPVVVFPAAPFCGQRNCTFQGSDRGPLDRMEIASGRSVLKPLDTNSLD
jgi:hypothetical protein